MKGLRTSLAALAACLLPWVPAHAAVTLPSWHGEPNSTSQVFLFNTASLSPAANSSANPHGTATAQVDIGFFGNGWENPVDLPISNPGYDGDGAWDIGAGSDGSITFQVPVAAAPPLPGQFYVVDLLVYVVAFKDLQQLPVASVLGLAPGDVVLEDSSVLSSRPPAGTWNELTWSAVLSGYSNSSITAVLMPPAGAVSVIDRVEIYTRVQVVPEPTTAGLAVLSAALLAGRRRRSQS
jgi:MYXO-CTERM domain-containing protein